MNYQKVYMNQIHSSSLLCQLAQMWRSQLLCDALICTGNVVTKAHRVVLLAACPMLQSMENASIGTELEVRLAADIKQEAVNTFLQYLYEGFMLLTEDNVKHVEKVARLLQVDSVIKCCSDFFKCLEKSTGKMHNANYKFDKYDLLEFRHVRTSNLQKTYQDRLMKRMSESPRPTSPTLGKRPRMHRPSTPQSDPSSQRADDAISMTQSYMGALGSGGSGSVRSATSSQSSRSGSPSVVEIVEDSLELIQREKAGPGQPESSRLAQQKTSISVASHVSNAKDTRVVNIADDGGGGKTTDSSADRIHSIPSARESSQSSQKLPYRDTQPSQNFHPSSSSFIPRIPPNQPPPPSLIQMSQSFSQGHSQDPSSQPRPQPIPTESFMDKFPFMTSTPQRSIPPSGAKPSFAAGSATQSGPPSQSTTFPSPAASQSPSQKETPPVIDRTEKREGESNSRPQEGHDPGPSGGTGDIADLAIVKIEKVGEDEIGGLMMQVDQGHGDGQRLGQFTGDDEQEYDESDLTGEWSQEDLSNEGSMLQGDPSGSGAMYMGPTSALGRYKCSYCGKRYGSKQGLKTHEREHSGIYPFTCKICKKGFSVRSRLLEHEMRHEDKPVGICFICGFEAKSFAGLRTHKNIHLENSYDCTECDKKFYSKQGLARHVILHKGGHVCDTCSKIFPSEEKLLKHLDSDSHKEKQQINEIFLKL